LRTNISLKFNNNTNNVLVNIFDIQYLYTYLLLFIYISSCHYLKQYLFHSCLQYRVCQGLLGYDSTKSNYRSFYPQLPPFARWNSKTRERHRLYRRTASAVSQRLDRFQVSIDLQNRSNTEYAEPLRLLWPIQIKLFLIKLLKNQ